MKFFIKKMSYRLFSCQIMGFFRNFAPTKQPYWLVLSNTEKNMRNIPIVTKNLLIINIVVFVLSWFLEKRGIDLNNLFGLHFFLAEKFRAWQFVTYMFMHGGYMHLLMNMFMLWMFGVVVEQTWGAKRFLIYYMVCGIGAGLCQELAQYANYSIEGMANYDVVNTNGFKMSMDAFLNLWTTVGASGAIYGVLLAFGMMFPDQRMFIIPIPFPVKAKWVIMGSIAMELYSAFSTTNDGVAHLAHLGGMLFGFLLIKYWKKNTYGYRNHYSEQQSNFFQNVKRNWQQRTNTTTHQQQTTQQRPESDWEYNARKQREQEEIDKILDKIRKNGYDSLTKAEKQKLFDSSKKN